ncbi:tRNA:m(4)X modification enzyme TRM13 homolog [Toxorhynchites rutilus septentrionalis]|uniref:tRNA:m(4)X modification enzyme TRM13 homolog n=1 Tax=Toxorhynchites rutilus septentrionalis TaxID=329112 RepID=UPI00247B18D7|nr:tRNA:m(4)X modification enzyme TRM13 homolog [Toxorhynchites rutilus septentrionalis]
MIVHPDIPSCIDTSSNCFLPIGFVLLCVNVGLSCHPSCPMSCSDEPTCKRPKMTEDQPTRCKYFVQRKKRYCKMTVGKGKQYCGEHLIHAGTTASGKNCEDEQTSQISDNRIPCPLDPKHTISAAKLEKHLKICNAKPMERPAFIEPGINALSEEEDCGSDKSASIRKLCDIPSEDLQSLIVKISTIYEHTRIGTIEDLMLEHSAFKVELSNESYGPQTLKHLVQSASLLGIVEHENFLQNHTAFVEFGAGKGGVAFWLATIIQSTKLTNTKVFLVDRASHRHKKDNKIEDRDIIQRVRADIGDLVLKRLDILQGSKKVIGIGKHLCGGATDLALRCLIRANREQQNNCPEFRAEGFVFALCCHHRCDWGTYVGKKFLLEKGIAREDFDLIVKMVSWAVCGTGSSREHRTEEPNDGVKYGLTRVQREDVGKRCKRVLDWGRIKYLEQNGFSASLKFYAKSEITLENVCLIGHSK